MNTKKTKLCSSKKKDVVNVEDVVDCSSLMLITVNINGTDEKFVLVFGEGEKLAYLVSVKNIINFLVASKIIKEESKKIKDEMVV